MSLHKQTCDDDCDDRPVIIDDTTEATNLTTRRVLVSGEITDSVAARVNGHLQFYAQTKDPVYMYISSAGGSMIAGYSIIDQMVLAPFPIYTIVRGQANSMAAIIAAYGQKNERYITPNASMMIHSITVFPSQPEPVGTSKLTTDFFEQDYKAKVKNLSRRVDVSYKKLLELMNSTHWMNAKAAIKLGFVDRIWTPKHEAEVDTIWRKIRAQKKTNN